MNQDEWKTLSMVSAAALQNKLKDEIELGGCRMECVKYVAGVDLAYWKRGADEYAVCCTVVLDRETGQVADSKYACGRVEVPYIPGCLAFRELPLVMETVEKLDISPDLYVFDGNGYLHPRHMGIATHASFYLKKPTVGVAKSYYKIGDTDYEMPENVKGAYTDIAIDGEVYGRVLRTAEDVKPVFVSAGNFIDLDTAMQLMLEFTNKESHIPVPTRLADLETHKMRRYLEEIMNEKGKA